MKNKNGPVLITCRHEGVDNAGKLIAALEKRGLKKGDLVAFEIAEQQLDNLVNRYCGRKFGLPVKALEGPQSVFLEKVFDFLMRKDVNILPFGSSGANKYIIRRIKKQVELEKSGKKVSRRYWRLTKFAMFPIRENIFSKRLHDASPKFVLGGSLHFPTLKKAFDYKETIDLGKPPLKFRAVAKMSRAHYAAIKLYKKVKRKLAMKRRI